MNYEELREYGIAEFDIARREGMLHSEDGRHSRFSESDIEDFLAKVAEAVKQNGLPQYAEFKTECGLRPRDICFASGVQDTIQSILKLLTGEGK